MVVECALRNPGYPEQVFGLARLSVSAMVGKLHGIRIHIILLDTRVGVRLRYVTQKQMNIQSGWPSGFARTSGKGQGHRIKAQASAILTTEPLAKSCQQGTRQGPILSQTVVMVHGSWR